MKQSVISKLLTELESLVQTELESGVEFWLARDLQEILGYTNWQNFRKVIGDPANLDCGSLLPLSVTQPAANRRGQQAGSRKAAAGCTQSKPKIPLHRFLPSAVKKSSSPIHLTPGEQ